MGQAPHNVTDSGSCSFLFFFHFSLAIHPTSTDPERQLPVKFGRHLEASKAFHFINNPFTHIIPEKTASGYFILFYMTL